MGVALLELGRPREAFRCYRRALRADAHDVGARFNAGELLLALGRLRYISPISPLYLPYISPISPLYLPCISPVSPLYRTARAWSSRRRTPSTGWWPAWASLTLSLTP